MKIYYEIPDGLIPEYAHIEGTPEEITPLLKESVNKMVDAYNTVAGHLAITLFEKAKFQAMWLLRGLEERIDTEGGIITIGPDMTFSVKEFSEELSEAILAALNKRP